MIRNKIKMNKNLLIVLAFLLFNIGYGQKTWTGATGTAWETDSNWSPVGKPTASENVLITNAANQPVINTAGAACAILELSNATAGSVVALTVKSGSFSPESITMNSSGGDTSDCSLKINTGKVSVSGNVTMNGTALQNDVTFLGSGNLLIGGVMTGGTLNADGIGTVNYNGAGPRAIGTYTYNNLTLSGSGVKTIATSGVIVNGTLTISGTAAASAAPTYGANAALQYNSLSSQTVGPEWITPFVATGGVEISTSNPGVSVVTINGNGTEKRFSDGVSLIVDEDASLVVTNTELHLGGDFINNRGSLTTDKFVYLTGGVNQSIDSFTSTEGIAMIKNAGIATFTGNINSKKLTINGLGTLHLGTGLTHSFSDWTRTQGTLNAGSSILKLSGNVIGNGGSFNAGTSTVEFNGGAQNLGTGSITYNNLTLSGIGTKTFGAKTTINETLSIVSGVVADLSANLIHTATNIKLGITEGSGGSWGSSLSNAVNKNNTFFASNNGIVNVGPTIVIDVNSLTGLNSVYGTPSASKNFTVSGTSLLGGILVTPPVGFEVSTDGTSFSETITIGKAGNIADTTVYVRLKGTINAADYSGNIALSSIGTTTINVPIATSTVSKAPLKITTDNQERKYGSDNPVLAVTYDKFVNGDTEASLTAPATIATTAVKGSPVGKYAITISGAASSNYSISYGTNGLLNVIPAELTITAVNQEREHGINNPVLTANYTGFVNGDTTASLSTPAKIVTTAVIGSPVGEYDITVSGATSSNYTIIFEKGILTVIKSSNAGLTDLAISKGTLSPTFAEGTKDYTAKVPNDIKAITVTPTTADTEAKVTVNGVEVPSGTISGEIPLQVGENTITTVVTAQDGTVNTYTVIVTREPSHNSGLIDLATSEGTLSPTFGEGTKDYTTTVPNDIKTITLTPVTADATATVTIDGKAVPSGTASGEIPLQVGKNEIATVVTAQDGTISTYTVIVTREPSHNSGLTDLAISEGTLSPTFAEGTKDYTATVPNDVTTIKATPTTADTTATVTINGKAVPSGTASEEIPLQVGKNEITTVVTAQDRTISTYTVIVTREPSHNAGLTDLAISEGTLSPTFAEGIKDYTATVPNDIKEIKVTPTTADTTAAITVNGEKVANGTASGEIPLKVGENEIVTVITAQDGTTINTYTVIVTREPSNEAGLSDIILSDGTLSPAFNTDTKDYKVDVPNETNSIVITPVTIDPTATVEMKIDEVTITDPTAPIDLKVGDNVVTVIVTAEDGTQETYTVIVNRADAIPGAIVPTNVITPNGDGKNDYWIVEGLDLYPNNSVKVFDRAARLVYSANNYNNDWDGSYKGSPANEDTYYYLIDLGNGSPKIKGFISIIRN